MNRQEKEQLVSEVKDSLAKAESIIVAGYKGISVAQMEQLRKKMKESGSRVKVAKNRIYSIALKDSIFSDVAQLLKGPVLVCWSEEDPVAPAKVLSAFAKKESKIEICGGALEGKLLSVNDVKALSSLPSIEGLRASLVGLISTPARNIASILQTPGGQIARVLNAKATG